MVRMNLRSNVRRPARVLHTQPPARSAFTLIEVLVVVAILMVLTALYWGSSMPGRQATRQKACAENFQKIYLAMEIYARDNSEKLPALKGALTSEDALDLLVPRCTVDTTFFICPGSKDAPLASGESLRKGKISYAYYMGRRVNDATEPLMSDRQVDAKSKNKGDAVFSTNGDPPGNNHRKDGGNILFGDGRAETSPPHAAFPLVFDHTVTLLNPKPLGPREN